MKYEMELHTREPHIIAVNLAQLEAEYMSNQIDEQAATIARLTAAHEMQGESLVVLPRWMVSNMEDKLKAQAAEIAQLTAKLSYAYEALESVK